MSSKWLAVLRFFGVGFVWEYFVSFSSRQAVPDESQLAKYELSAQIQATAARAERSPMAMKKSLFVINGSGWREHRTPNCVEIPKNIGS